MKEVQGATVVDDKGQDHLTKFVFPVADTTNDAGPRRIEQRGSQLTDATRRARLQPYADELVSFLRRQGHSVTTATASKHLREQPGFGAAMGNVPSFGAFIRLFASLKLMTGSSTGGASKVRLADEAPRRRMRGKQPDPVVKTIARHLKNMAYTKQERIVARRAAWQKYNRAHKDERATHNKEYVQKENVKARRRQMRAQSRVHTQAPMDREPAQRVGPTTRVMADT